MRILLFGATGFLGGRVLERLLDERHEVVAVVRDPAPLARYGTQVSVVRGDIAVPSTYRGQGLQCDASINCVGLLRGGFRGREYARVVVRGTQAWVKECQEAGIQHVVLVSANGADPEGPPYARTKWTAEQAVRNAGPAWTIFRPSFIIGPGGIVEQFGRLLKLRVLPVFGRQDYLGEPIDRDDVVAAILASLRSAKAKNRVFHLGGPDQVTYREMVDAIRRHTGTKCWMPTLPRSVGYAMAGTLGWLPFFPATVENLRLLFKGNLVPERDVELVLGIQPKPFEASVKAAVEGLHGAKTA
ncbi:MAG: NAD(P)H-binding protein [Euryarchaeota archaeon]|nr:NAD(P)H-binding protein [Euryarchaeota archaeon]